jgi:restriction system protein
MVIICSPFLLFLGIGLLTCCLYKRYYYKKVLKHLDFKIIENLSDADFEKFVEILFKERGFKVNCFPNVYECGIDFIASKNKKTIVVQTDLINKKFNNNFAIEKINLAKNIYEASIATIIINREFTSNEIECANKLNVKLISRQDILNFIGINRQLNPIKNLIN